MANTNSSASQVGTKVLLVTSFRPYRPNPEAEAAYAGFQASVEQLLGIQEFFDEGRAVQAQVAHERVIEETDTKNERVQVAELELSVDESAGSAFLSWDAPAQAFAEAFAQVSA